ncbi:pentatricopeptide repeat-containing protein At5g55740, chloroplastic [Rutidosis leptorrhynchoides]|uniref:pentatricopeptide repeat-containing protein At5g55740, chloroplastic n=1 Tax=Rutidosis leptorrhynchoides TaxID=125765 RepID=UPI003A994055
MSSLQCHVIPINHSPLISKSPTSQTQLILKPQKHHQILYNNYFKHISSFCKDGKLQEAVNILLELDSQSFNIGPDVYSDLLQGCVYERNLSLGQQIHSRIIKKGETLVKNEYIETKLVVFYAKCDLFDAALSLFNKVEKNVFSWAAVIGIYCRMGLFENGLLGFCEMIENGFKGDNFIVPIVLKACGGLLYIGFGKGVHGYVLKMGFKDCVFVGSSLVDMYGKCGDLISARKVFDDMVERNVVTWNSMMVSYAQNGMYEEAIRVFRDMIIEGIQPSVVSLVSFLSASANLYAIDEGKQGHSIAILNGLDLGSIVGTSLINLYSKTGLIKDAEKVFSNMKKKDVVAWNLMVSCYVQYKQIDKMINLCRKMLSEGLKFDSVTLTSIITIAGDIQNLKIGKVAHCHCVRNDLMSDVTVASCIIDMYAKCNKIHEARRVFSSLQVKDLVLWNTLLAAYAELGSSGETLKLFYEMQLEGVSPNVVSWNSVILAFLRNGQVKEAMVSFYEMERNGIEANLITHAILITGLVQNGLVDEAIGIFQEMQQKGIKPNIVCIVCVLSACKNSASLQLGRAVHAYVLRHEMHMNVVMVTSIVDMYAKCGNINQARMVFDIFMIKELALYNAMISGYALHGCYLEALEIFKRLKDEGLEPDSITFTSILSLCRHCGFIIEGLEIFVDMIVKHNVTPSLEHYGCVVSLLSKCGNLEAFRLVKSMPFEPDSYMLGSLLDCCKYHNELDLAEYLTENLAKLEPSNSGNFVALSNAYAANGMWDEVFDLRRFMKEKGIRKNPGCSWVQVGTKHHVFVANDRSKSQSDEIYSTLALLRMEMQADSNL